MDEPLHDMLKPPMVSTPRCASRRRAARFVLGALAPVAVVVAGLATGVGGGVARALEVSKPLGDFGIASWLDELPQGTVSAVLQTRDGYLWAGTAEGLVRFDGVSFTVFDLVDRAGAASTAVTALCEDRSGALWIGTNGGGVIRFFAGKLTLYTAADGLADDVVYAMQEDGEGNLWVGTGSGLVRRVGERFEVAAEAAGGPTTRVRALAVDRDGNLWVGSQQGLLLRHAGVFERLTASDSLPNSDVRAVATEGSGVVYVGTEGGGLSILAGGKIKTLTSRDGLAGDAVRALLVDREGAVWVGSEGGGISRLWQGRIETLDSSNGLPANLIRSLAEDHEGSVWIGTNGGGLAVLRDQRFLTYGPEHGLANPNIRVVLEDRAGDIWVGGDGGGLTRLQHGTAGAPGKAIHFTTADGLPNDFVRALLEARDGTLWVGTNGGGLAHLVNGRFQVLTQRDGLVSNGVSALVESADGTLWIGTNESGLHRLRPQGPAAGRPERIELPAAAGDVRTLYEARNGVIWVGTTRGVCKVTPGKTVLLEMLDGTVGVQGFAFLEDPDGSLWIGTDRGLWRLHQGRLTRFDHRSGLPNGVVFRILDDARGSFWLTSNRGITRVGRDSLMRVEQGAAAAVEATVYAQGDGLRSRQCNGASQPAGWRARDGRLLIPTNRGLAVIDPARKTANSIPLPVRVESVDIDGKDVLAALLAGGRGGLGPGVERLEFHYTALSFRAPERLTFRYMLEGFDHDWIDAGARRSASYTRIGPGQYRFRVQALNGEGGWTEAAPIGFAIAPYFWETRWFIALVALSLAAMGFFMSRARLRRLEGRAAELQTVVRDRTRQLREANQRLEELSFLDGLTGIPNRRRFDSVLATEWRRAARSGEPLCVLVMDVDFFKQYNDSLGHPAGDTCLAQLAEVISDQVHRPGDLAARLGGEEFAFIAASTDGAGGELLATRLRERVEELAIAHPSSSVAHHVTISVGVAATIPELGVAPSALVAAADRALYAAKHSGRNRTQREDLPGAPPPLDGGGKERVM